GWTKATVKERLARARELLRGRLTRRGLTLSAPLFAAMLTQNTATAAAPAALAHLTLRAALGGTVPAPVAALAAEAGPSLLATRLPAAAVLLLGLVLVGYQLSAAGDRSEADEPAPGAPAKTEPAGPRAEQQTSKVDAQGDPLPPGALLR